MRLCTVIAEGADDVGIALDGGVLLVSDINKLMGSNFGPSLYDIVVSASLVDLAAALQDPALHGRARPLTEVTLGPLLRCPPKLWGVGLNYLEHAHDLEVEQPKDMPGSYLRPASTIIGHGDNILLPAQSKRVTAEAELGVVIGTTCKDVKPLDAADVIFGYTTVLDMTAEDVIRVNPRYIPWSKAFDTFCGLGPWVVTPDEVVNLAAVRVSTVVNGEVIASNRVSAMMWDPLWQVSYFSSGMTLEAGSVIATGTPGAGVIHSGDIVEAKVEGIGDIRNQVSLAPLGA